MYYYFYFDSKWNRNNIKLSSIHKLILGSIYLTLCIAVERYATVCHPYIRVSVSTSRNAYFMIPRYPDPPQLAGAVLPPPDCDLHHRVQPPEVLGVEGEWGQALLQHAVIWFVFKDWGARRKLLQRSGGSQHDINQHWGGEFEILPEFFNFDINNTMNVRRKQFLPEIAILIQKDYLP